MTTPADIIAAAARDPSESREWYCHAEGTGAQVTHCSPDDPRHSSPCGWLPEDPRPATCPTCDSKRREMPGLACLFRPYDTDPWHGEGR